jgi:hypothetical protein
MCDSLSSYCSKWVSVIAHLMMNIKLPMAIVADTIATSVLASIGAFCKVNLNDRVKNRMLLSECTTI